jgi:hypothetical protein
VLDSADLAGGFQVFHLPGLEDPALRVDQRNAVAAELTFTFGLLRAYDLASSRMRANTAQSSSTAVVELKPPASESPAM